MPEWWKDAALITAIIAALEKMTGILGSSVRGISGYFATRKAEAEARKTKRALQETIRLKDMELEVKDRIIAAITAELDRVHRNGGST